MIPTVGQQLFAVRNTVAKVVMPAIDPADGFATEQAGLVLACLDWMMDIQASEFRYERLEHAQVRETLAALLELGDDADSRSLLAETEVVPTVLEVLRDEVKRLQAAGEARFDALCSDDEQRTSARRILTAAAREQAQRELSWCRMTGFPQGGPENIAAVLTEQEAASRPAVATH